MELPNRNKMDRMQKDLSIFLNEMYKKENPSPEELGMVLGYILAQIEKRATPGDFAPHVIKAWRHFVRQ